MNRSSWARDPDVVQTWNMAMDVIGGVASLTAGVPWIVREGTGDALYPASHPMRR